MILWANICFMVGSIFLFIGTLLSTLHQLKVI